jgi:hypothetical protein
MYFIFLKRQDIKIEKGGIIFSKFEHIEYINYLRKRGLKK